MLAAIVAAAPASGAGIDEPLRETLLQMARDDQDGIRLATADPSKPMDEATEQRVHELNSRNASAIRRIVETRGWPGISLVGPDGAGAAWLVVQHMDYDLAFQERCLALMQAAFEKGEVLPRNLAYLTDRVLTAQGKPQRYGTQGRGVDSPADEARIDRNRAAIGLPPWRQAVEDRKKVYEHGYGATPDR
jgi:hypothetical protein